MKLRHLADWQYVSESEWEALLARGVALSAGGHRWNARAKGKSIALVFFNPSLRTRASMDLAAAQLGAHATVLEPGQGTWGIQWRPGELMDGTAAEHISEQTAVLSRYYDALAVRVFATGENYAEDRDDLRFNTVLEHAGVPVINLESAFYHPCQALADAVTLRRHFGGDLQSRRFVLHWCYHPKALPMAVPNSTLLMAARLGFDVTVARPKGFELDPGVMQAASNYAESFGKSIEQTDEPGCEGAHVIYAKAWGGRSAYDDSVQEVEARSALRHWRVTSQMQQSGQDAQFMHPLPVRRNVVVDDAVIDGPASLHLDQAENRIHAQKAILEWVWGLAR